jgi:putative FmdB family regulatory protein
MPIYEYWCPECKTSFEKLRAMGSKDDEVSCSRCGSPVKRMLSLVAAVGRSSDVEGGVMARHASTGGGCACGGACACRSHN